MLTQKTPASPIGSWALAVLLTYTRSWGDSAETKHTACILPVAIKGGHTIRAGTLSKILGARVRLG